MTITCGTCFREFYAGWRARDQHCEATGHDPPRFECWECDDYFDDQEDLDEHMGDYDHWGNADYECRFDWCYTKRRTESDRRTHEIEDHLFCGDCERSFQNRNNIKQAKHLNSNIHRPTSMQCPFCNASKGTATGLVHHLERGGCPNAPLDRDEMYRQVRRRDPQGVISKHLISWTGGTEYTATERSWNRSVGGYECKLCGRTFGSLQALNQHLASPLHQEAYYHCPKRVCARSFTTLAGLINHLESESCGFTSFRKVQNNVHSLVDPTRRITFG